VVEQPKPAPAVRTVGISTGWLSSADQFSEESPIEVAPAKVQGVRLTIDGKAVVMDLRTWDRQSSDFQKRALRNGSNAVAINALYLAEDERKAAARNGR
jgi:hypothetical protein